MRDAGRLGDCNNIYLEEIELNVRGMLIRGSTITWTDTDLNRLREAISTLDGIGARVERRLAK